MTILLITGVIGYRIIEGYTLLEAFYMTVITIATVGYGEVHELSDTGRLFTAFLIITSFGTFAYAVSTITRFVVDGEFNNIFKSRKLNAAIEKLSDHVIICGYGRNGRQAAQILKIHNTRFVIIERNEKVTGQMDHKYKDLIINGDSTQDDILVKAGVMRAKALITTLPVDADNLFIVLSARNLNKKLTIISRASDDGSDTKLKIAGANNVIMPDKVGGAQMASLVMKPDVMEFVDYLITQGGNNNNLEEITLENIKDELINKTLRELEIRNKSGANIIGFKTIEGEYIINPSAETRLIPESKIFVLGTPEQLRNLKSILGV
ncbi:MAG: TrkA family potassium uptake protein [Bacteroidia bacterium]